MKNYKEIAAIIGHNLGKFIAFNIVSIVCFTLSIFLFKQYFWVAILYLFFIYLLDLDAKIDTLISGKNIEK